jgi:hypothetical protein
LERLGNRGTPVADHLAGLRVLRTDGDIRRQLTKGAHIQIVGEIQTREYVAKDGAKKSFTDVRVRRFTHLNKTEKVALESRGPPRKRPLKQA